MMMLIPSLSYAFFCPPKPTKLPSNNIIGTIEKVDEPESPIPISPKSVRIWVNGTNHFTVANEKGYFFLTDVEQDRITLRFEYLGRQIFLDLGEVGWNNTVVLEKIVLGHGAASFGKRSIEPFKVEREK
jgi:hypothetical protein